jgi:hypothetical protein
MIQHPPGWVTAAAVAIAGGSGSAKPADLAAARRALDALAAEGALRTSPRPAQTSGSYVPLRLVRTDSSPNLSGGVS